MDFHLWKSIRTKESCTSFWLKVQHESTESQLSHTTTTNHCGKWMLLHTNRSWLQQSYPLLMIYVLLLSWEWPAQLGSRPRSRTPAVCFSKRAGPAWQRLMSLSCCLTHLEKQPTNLHLFVTKEVFTGESSWFCIIVNKEGLSATVTVWRFKRLYIFLPLRKWLKFSIFLFLMALAKELLLYQADWKRVKLSSEKTLLKKFSIRLICVVNPDRWLTENL